MKEGAGTLPGRTFPSMEECLYGAVWWPPCLFWRLRLSITATKTAAAASPSSAQPPTTPPAIAAVCALGAAEAVGASAAAALLIPGGHLSRENRVCGVWLSGAALYTCSPEGISPHSPALPAACASQEVSAAARMATTPLVLPPLRSSTCLNVQPPRASASSLRPGWPRTCH